jgi:putative peptidoglycan lipid II flippase
VESAQGVANQAVLSTGGILVQGVVRFLYSVVIGNALGRAVLGVVNSSIALAMLASLLVPSATAMAATKYVARARGAGDLVEVERVARHLSRVTLVAVLALGVAGTLLSFPLFHVSVTEAVLTGALAMAYSLYVYVRGFLFGAGQVVRATVWDTLSAAAALVGLALVLLAHANAWLLLPLTVCYGAYAAASWPRGHGTLAPEVRREMRGFLWLSLVNSVATGGFLQLTMVAAGYWDRVDAGSFAAALSLATPASLASRSLTLVLFPSLAAAHGRGDTEGAQRQTDVATRGLVVLSLATFGPLMLVSPALIDLLYRRGPFE